MPFQSDSFGHRAYVYAPGEGTLIERCPDKLPSSAAFWHIDQGREVTMIMEVRGLGCLRMRATSGHEDGHFRFEGVALVTREEILFD